MSGENLPGGSAGGGPGERDGTAPAASDRRPIPNTLVDLLTQRAEQRRDRLAFSFSRDGAEQPSSQVSYRGLDARARHIAAGLRRAGAAGDCVLVLCPPGLDFIAAFFGCLYAGATAVPVHPPTREHLVPRVESIIADVQPRFALATAEMRARIQPTVDGLAGRHPLQWCLADPVDTDNPQTGGGLQWVKPDIDAGTVAMVQYTSGSTSAPKGVVLTHGNLMHNLEAIRRAWHGGFDMDDYGVFWLPPFHDMGLIGGLLETLYVGGSSALMPPNAFIKQPMRWLEAMSRHRAIISAAPNFAYDLCVELSTPEQRAALDLSNWRAALCGAEPVRTATLRGFAEAFAPAGFRAEALLPVYGLAEATLLVSGGSDSPVPVVRHIDRAALGENRVVEVAAEGPSAATLVGCGRPQGGQRVAIVDPETRQQCPPDEVGEIWVSGPSVAQGYWGAPELSEEAFAAHLAGPAGTGDGPFLRTGDLGFLRSGELFVTGRRKDLIIIRGTNHYPNDIELTVQDCHPALMPGRGAVFSVAPEPDGAEQLVVVQEINHSQLGGQPGQPDPAELSEIIRHIRTAVTGHHEVRPYAVVLVQPLQLPTTSSGKIQRNACRRMFLDGELPVVSEWRTPSAKTRPEAEPESRPAAPTAPAAPAPAATPAPAGPDAARIADWLIAQLSRDLELPVAEVDPALPFAFYGLDSIHAVRLTAELEKWLGRELEPTLAYEYPTIDLLAEHLAGDHSAAPTPAAPADDHRPVADEPIAIVGIGCRFPGADGPAAFWRLLADGVDATSDVPADRWDAEAFYNPDPSVPGTAVSRRGGFLDRVDNFDYKFFSISPRESAQMDPQQRLLLEVAWEALEDAGQVPERLAGSRTGVFVGIATNDYGYLRLGQPQLVDAYTGTGNALSIAANRLSYMFDFHGPSMAVDTACSSSLVAVDLACRSLRDGECTLAVAGGVNVILSPVLAINFTKARVMSPEGRCKTFDADADGYVRGEGAGVVVLKPLSRALADNDPVYAVIRGTATNSDGRTNGLIAPGERTQEAVLTAAYRRAGLAPGAVQYVEAHGTGTALGDAIEAKALGAVMGNGRPPGSRCLIGSVKTNIGHLEAAAGVAGLIKVALALQHRAIPPSLNFTRPNPHIPFDSLALDVVRTLTPWPDNGGRAIAGVSSFGFGGTNAHVVLAEAPQVRAALAPGGAGDGDSADGAAAGRAELLPLSARSPEALAALADRYQPALAAVSAGLAGVTLGDLCYTAGARRGHHDYRLCVVGNSPAAMLESLAAYRQGESRPGLSVGHCRRGPGSGHRPAVTFVFSGQGSQWAAMGVRLRDEEPVFRAALAECDQALSAHLGCSVLTELARYIDPDAGQPDRPTELTDVGLIQPAIFAVQVALAALWRSWGVQPAVVIGHSMGEVAAAHVAGALSLHDAARVICARAEMLRGVRGRGAMIVAEATPAEAQQLIADRADRVAIAASNSHRSTVLSGDRTVLADLLTALEQRDRFCRWIDVDVASHSPQMDELTAGLRDMLDGITPVEPTVPIYSTVGGDLLTGRLLDAEYWAENLRSPVRFSPALRRLLGAGNETFVEISPHPILLTAIREDAEDLGRSVTLLPSMRRDDDGRETVLASIGTLYTLGQPISWEELYPPGSRCVPAPTYPWQRVHSWLEAGGVGTPTTPMTPMTPKYPGAERARQDRLTWRGPLRSAAHPETVLAEAEIGAGLLPALADHRIDGAAVLPAALLLRLVQSAVSRAFGTANPALDSITMHAMAELPDAEPYTVQVVLQGHPAEAISFECYGGKPAEPGHWSLLASGTATTAEPARVGEHDTVDAVRQRCPTHIGGSVFYRNLADHALQYGPKFQSVQEIWRRDGEAVARLAPTGASAGAGEVDAAVLLDAGFQAIAAALPGQAAADSRDIYLPVGLQQLHTYGPPADGAWCHAVAHPVSPGDSGDGWDTLTGDVFVMRDGGDVVAVARGLRFQRVPRQPVAARAGLRDRIYQVRWQPASLQPDRDTFTGSAKPGTWMIFSDGTALTDTLRDHLEAHSQTCVLVEPVAGLAELEHPAPDSYRLDPAQPGHFRQLLAALDGGETHQAPCPPCRGVVHLWSLLAPPPAETSADSLRAATTLGALSTLHLLQALSQADWADAPRLWLITRGAQAADAPEASGGPAAGAPVSVAQAPLWGMGRSVDHEHPELRCGRIDLSAGGAGDPEESRALFAEVWADGPESDVALRGHRRYVARLERYAQQAQAGDGTATETTETFGAEASYLITGGLGAVGTVVAEWLVAHGARHLVLMGRSDPSPTAQVTLDRLHGGGAEVRVARGDVTRPDQVAAVLESVASSMPPLRGVIHAAGIVDEGGIIERLDERQLRDVLAPKVEGAWNLHTLTRDAELDFFVLFSSVASILGSPGASTYAGANAFLDALAWHRRAEGRPALCVNWGVWAELGLLAQADLHSRFTRYGLEPMPADSYLRALSLLLAQSATQAAVFDIDWARWRLGADRPLLADLRTAGPADRSETAGPAGPATELYEALRNAAPAERRPVLESYLRDLVAGKLGLAPTRLDTRAPLNSLGVDSLITLELRIQVEHELGIVVPVTRLLDGPSVASLAAWLADQLSEVELPDLARTPDSADHHIDQENAPPGGDGETMSEADSAPGIDLLTRVPELSDDAVDELLQQVLDEQRMPTSTHRKEERGGG